MNVGAVAAVNAASLASDLSSAVTHPVFDAIVDQLTALNTQLKANDQAVRALALGDSVSLHEVMMTGERTRLTFDLMLQVRNRLLEAYQELTRMQV